MQETRDQLSKITRAALREKKITSTTAFRNLRKLVCIYIKLRGWRIYIVAGDAGPIKQNHSCGFPKKKNHQRLSLTCTSWCINIGRGWRIYIVAGDAGPIKQNHSCGFPKEKSSTTAFRNLHKLVYIYTKRMEDTHSCRRRGTNNFMLHKRLSVDFLSSLTVTLRRTDVSSRGHP